MAVLRKRRRRLESLMRCVSAICLVTLVACASSEPRGSAREVALRHGSALEFGLSQIDPRAQYIVIADDKSIAEVQRLLPHREVMTASQFVQDHPPDAHNIVPASVLVLVPEFEGNNVHVRMYIPGVLPPPPPHDLGVCGYGYNFILARDGQAWCIVDHWQTAC